jgi:nitrogen fixation/metabolism regulation signal transduction histidine kinase
MRELALHILDIAQNSVAAGARHIWLTISENEQGYFVFSVRDDGKGMDSEMLQRVRDPFVTSRTTRKVGMGIPFIDMVTQRRTFGAAVCARKGNRADCIFCGR